MTLARAGPLVLAALTGAATVFGFAPFGVALLPMVTLSILFAQWRNTATPGAAAGVGFAFGLGMFGVGISWVYVALEKFGGVPAAIAVAGTAGFVIYLSLWIALAGYVAARFTPRQSLRRLVAAAATWTLAECARSFGYPGFPWLSV
jgi:apolipoprotein N-acyltransferase